MKFVSNLRWYGLAIILCAFALALAWPFDSPSSCFFIAVMVISIYGGRGPGLFAVLLSSVAFDYFFLPRRLPLAVGSSSHFRLSIFVGAALLVNYLVEARRRSDAARSQIDAQYRTVADTAPDAIFSINENYQIVFANPAATRIFGWEPAELVGRSMTLVLRDFTIAGLAVTELVGLRRDGTEFPVEVIFSEVFRDGRRCFTGFVRDVSEAKQAREALRKSESFLAEGQKLSHTGSFSWNVATGELFWSEETYRIIGYDPGIIPHLNLVMNRVHPEDQQSVQELLTNAIKNRADMDFEHRFLMPDGSIKYAHVVTHLVRESLDQNEYIGAVTDITAIKRAEEEQRRSEDNYRELVELSPDAIFILDDAGNFISTNLAGLDMLRCRAERVRGLNIRDTYLADERPLATDRLHRLKTGSSLRYERTLVRRDGTTTPVEISVSPIRHGYLQAVLRDISERQQAQEALKDAFEEIQRSEDRLRLIIDTIPALAWSTRPDGSVEFVNRRWRDYAGLSAEDATGWGWTNAIHPKDLSTLSDVWRAALVAGEPSECEARMRRFDGEYRWFLFRTTPLRDESGKVVKWYGTNTDIEDRKRAEEAVRNSESNLRLLIDSIPGMVCVSGADGNLEYANQRVLDFVGMRFSDLRDGGWAQVVHPEDSEYVLNAWNHSLATGDPMEILCRMLRFDATYRWSDSRAHPSFNDQGQIKAWYGLIFDVDDRVRAEEALRESERNLFLLIETIPAILVWSTTAEGEIDYVNQRVLRYTGKVLDDFSNLGFRPIIHPDDADATIQAWLQNLTSGESYELTNRLRQGDGVYRWFRLLVQPLRDKEGKVFRWYGFAFDIDDSRKLEEALRHTQARLSRAMQIATIGELAASIAHEVNQPLAAVVVNGYACRRWLSAQPPDLAKANEAAERIIRDGKDAGEVVQRIRALFRQAAPDKIPLDLNEVVAEVLRLLTAETVRQQVAVETDLEEDLPPVMGDRLQLQQVIFNLLWNGIEAMETVTSRAKKLVIRSKRQGADVVLIEIRDFGIGLTDLDKVFEAFFTTKENGMGMGLAICRSIIDANYGALWAAATEGPGATFCFTLPLNTSSDLSLLANPLLNTPSTSAFKMLDNQSPNLSEG